MYNRNIDLNKYTVKKESLDKDNFDNIQQDLESLRFYSKCLDGTSYIPINNLENIYDKIEFVNDDSWYIDNIAYNVPISTIGNKVIDDISSLEKYRKYVAEDGFTLKNLFTDKRVIDSSIDNYLEVDLVSTESIENLTSEKKGLMIDSYRVINGHRILIKDQTSNFTLSNTIDPDTYFTSNYYIVEEGPTTTEYFIYNEENGIYRFENNFLVREDDLDIYEDNMRYSVVAKMGENNRDTQFHLSRLLNGYYPMVTENEPIEFIEKKNWVLRNKLEYQNVKEVIYKDIFFEAAHVLMGNQIPDRYISIGAFGTIILNQHGVSNIIRNKFKSTLNSISDTNTHYFICGNNGTILKIDKITFEIEKIESDTFHSLTSIDFFNNNIGVIVGEHNNILHTTNGGETWKDISASNFSDYSYNSVIYNSINKFYIIGDNGAFLEYNKATNGWTINDIKINKKIDSNDSVYVYRDITDFKHIATNSWNLAYNYSNSNTIGANKEFLIMSGREETVIIYDINNFISEYDFLHISFENNTLSDINDIFKIEYRNDTIFLLTSNGVFEVDINLFNSVENDTNVLLASDANFLNTDLEATYQNFKIVNDNLYIVGDESIFKNYDLISNILADVDSNFGNDLKSKFLYLDYDVASKLNFFDNSGNYRLPISFEHEYTGLANFSNLDIFTLSNQKSWIDYMLDENKVFEYNTSLTSANEVRYSTNFNSFSSPKENTFSILPIDVNKNLEDFIELLPTEDEFSTTINAPNTASDLYLYDKFMIIKGDTTVHDFDKGDVIRIESDVVEANLMINKIVDIGADRYFYIYSYFNNNIINNLKDSSNPIVLTNLNKFELFDTSELMENFNKHPLSEGYEFILENDGSNDTVIINPLFNEKTAYYNLQAKLETIASDSTVLNMTYSVPFLDFNFTPTYNIFDYLYNIDSSIFDNTKEFGTMPIYNAIPIGNSDVIIDNNKIVFNPTYEFHYESFWKNTFIDITIYGSSNESTERLLIEKKYYDSNIDRYIIETNKKIETPSSPTSIDIKSRRLLTEISNDLQMLNNIQKSERDIITSTSNFTNLENEIKYRFSTNNYSKILLSDKDIKDSLTGIVYFDNKNQMSLNIIKLETEVDLNITNIQNYFGNVSFTTSSNHNLKVGDYVYINDSDGIYIGIHIVQTILSPTSFVTYNAWLGASNLTGIIKHYIFDEYLNYIPSDIIDVGIDKKGKIAVAIEQNNVIKSTSTNYSLVNLDLTKFKFKLLDNLSIVDINERFEWVLEAEIEDAIIGQTSSGDLVWYKGIWHCGRWFSGEFQSGIWRSGTFFDGKFNSVRVDKKSAISYKANENISNPNYSIWYSGDFRGGEFNNGTFYKGNFYSGIWRNGIMNDGTFHQGTWENGEFRGGVWITGTWLNGKFNTDYTDAFWLDGSFEGGDFENGTWFNGTLIQKRGGVKTRFGTKSNNSRKSIWRGGEFYGGEFHSYMNEDKDNNPIASINNKFSIWETGYWSNGNWYGGTAININWNSGNWYEGIVSEMEVVAVIHGKASPAPDPSIENEIVIKGKWYFNMNNTIYIIDNLNGYQTNLGSNSNIGQYLIKNVQHIENNGDNYTQLTVYEDLSSVNVFGYTYTTEWTFSPISPTQHSVISYMKKAEWESGIWKNGIFDGNNFKGGMWLNGVFLNGNFS